MFYKQECRFGQVNDTFEVQRDSLYTFAAALGYEPLEDTEGRLISFFNGRATCVGQSTISVNKMIEKHNKLPGQVFRQIQDGAKVNFADFVNTVKGEDLIVGLFAGYTRIVRKVKMVYIKRERKLVVQSHKVTFQTRRDAAQHAEIQD